MGRGFQALAVLLRLVQLGSACIVTGLLSRFFARLHSGRGQHSDRLIYMEVCSVLGIIAALALLLPLRYSCFAWPADLVLFIAWIVAFGLLAAKNIRHTCASEWYRNYWEFYSDRRWRYFDQGFDLDTQPIARTACNRWRAILTFTFLGAIAFLISAIVGASVFREIRSRRDTTGTRHGGQSRKKTEQAKVSASETPPVQDEPVPHASQV